MPRSIWSGSLSFGLVNIPVRLVSAVIDRGLHFHQLHDKDGARIHEQRICSHDGEVVPLEHIVKGYEVSKGKTVPVTAEELEALAPEKNRAIKLESFVPLEEINPVYFQHPYYLLPDQGSESAYGLLRGVLQETKRVGVARMVMRGKEDLVALRAVERALSLSVLWFYDEVIRPNEIEGVPKDAKVPEKQLELARQIVESLEEEFKPERYHDDYRERVLEMVKRKAKGEKPVPAAASPEPKSNVVDLMQALQASLGQKGKKLGANGHAAKTRPKRAGASRRAHA